MTMAQDMALAMTNGSRHARIAERLRALLDDPSRARMDGCSSKGASPLRSASTGRHGLGARGGTPLVTRRIGTHIATAPRCDVVVQVKLPGEALDVLPAASVAVDTCSGQARGPDDAWKPSVAPSPANQGLAWKGGLQSDSCARGLGLSQKSRLRSATDPVADGPGTFRIGSIAKDPPRRPKEMPRDSDTRGVFINCPMSAQWVDLRCVRARTLAPPPSASERENSLMILAEGAR